MTTLSSPLRDDEAISGPSWAFTASGGLAGLLVYWTGQPDRY